MGIPISIDPSWLVILGILTYELGTGVFPFQLGRGFRSGLNLLALGLALLTSLLFFGSVLAHELSHAWMAQRRGIPVIGITLFIFGGVAQIGDEADRPATEFLVAIMGPLMSLALALLFAAFWIWSLAVIRFLPGARLLLLPASVAALYLAQSNGILVLFNLLPGFPLDGGRVFRALVWGLLHDLRRATRLAALVGRGIAVLLVLVGVWGMFQIGLGGAWSLLIGIFLWQAAGDSYRSVLFREALARVSVGALMKRPEGNVPVDLSIPALIELYLLPHRNAVYAVEENGMRVGLIGGAQLSGIPQPRWEHTRLRDVMLFPRQAAGLTPADTALSALQKLARSHSGAADELPVLENGQLVGVIGHEEIGRYLAVAAATR